MKITNRKAFFDYEIFERFEAGINLIGSEVKAIKEGHADLSGSFVRIIGSEAYLVNAKIFLYEYSRLDDYDPRRTRKLLLHKNEIIALKSKADGSNLSIVPLSFYTSHSLIKLELALGKGKKVYEKRQRIKKKDELRELEIELRGKI
ncbi:MAG: SsrA-binding protein SmpB [bacterium]|nr:SsrA-binding protein SmpB [bacterium]